MKLVRSRRIYNMLRLLYSVRTLSKNSYPNYKEAAFDQGCSVAVLKQRLKDYPRTPNSIALFRDLKRRVAEKTLTLPHIPDDPFA